MKASKKVITMLMLDGDVNGCTKVELKNWVGIAYKVSREKLAEYVEREDFQKNGVYFLFSDDKVYIGQAGVRQNASSGIAARLSEHYKNPQKDFWTDAVFFVTKEDDFGATELNFLENKFYNMAKNAKRYTIENKVSPNPGNTTEAKEAELEDFANTAELILGVLGYKVFEKKVDAVKKSNFDLNKSNIPPLPDSSLKVGEFVRSAMVNLAEAGYEFTDEELLLMQTKEWSKSTLNINYEFLRKYIENETTTKDEKGYSRFWSNTFTFGNTEVLISSQWFDTNDSKSNRNKFIEWYNSLKNKG